MKDGVRNAAGAFFVNFTGHDGLSSKSFQRFIAASEQNAALNSKCSAKFGATAVHYEQQDSICNIEGGVRTVKQKIGLSLFKQEMRYVDCKVRLESEVDQILQCVDDV